MLTAQQKVVAFIQINLQGKQNSLAAHTFCESNEPRNILIYFRVISESGKMLIARKGPARQNGGHKIQHCVDLMY